MAKKTTIGVMAATAIILLTTYYNKMERQQGYGAPAKAGTASLEIHAKPVATENGHINLNAANGVMEFKGFRLSTALEMLLGFSNVRTVVGLNFPDGLFDISATHPVLRNEPFVEAARAGLEKQFGIRVQREERETEVLVMKAPGGKPPAGLHPPTGGTSTNANSSGVSVGGAPPTMLAMTLERVTGKPVVQEPMLPGKFSYNVSWQQGNPEAAIAAVRQLGYEVVPETRKIEFLILDKRD